MSNPSTRLRVCAYRIDVDMVRISFSEPIVPPKFRGEVDPFGKGFSISQDTAQPPNDHRYLAQYEWAKLHYAPTYVLAKQLAEGHKKLCLIRAEGTSPYDILIKHGLAAAEVETELRLLVVKTLGIDYSVVLVNPNSR
jgi:hypothetical protein